MSTEHTEHHLPHLPHRHTQQEVKQDTPGADEFVEVHESDVPWDRDQPLVRENEQYERLAAPETYPSEGIPGPGGMVPPR
jgi:hypothetical protein